jgi:hypothetical protein
MAQPLNLASSSITFGFNASQQSQHERPTGSMDTVRFSIFSLSLNPDIQIQQRRLDLHNDLQQTGELTADMSQTHGARSNRHDQQVASSDQPGFVCEADQTVSMMTRRSSRTSKHHVPSAHICEIPFFWNNPKSSRVVEMEATPTGP